MCQHSITCSYCGVPAVPIAVQLSIACSIIVILISLLFPVVMKSMHQLSYFVAVGYSYRWKLRGLQRGFGLG